MTERLIAPEQLDFIDVVTSSHNHTDHLDGEPLIPLLKANADMKVILPQANVGFAAERMFELNTVSPQGIVKYAEQIGQKHRLLNCGE
jgi:L-ascorbate metabolism protein UlaG (beta-lactamase superfamily)